MDLFMLILFGAVIVLLVVFIMLYATSQPYPDLSRTVTERTFLDPTTNERIKFPSLKDEASKWLSVIVPSYNEEERLPKMMDETLTFLEEQQKSYPDYTFEVIVVDDGSKDKTTEVALKYSKKFGAEKVRVLTFEKNRGKGGAVRLGFFSARGRYLLFADADGASKFSDISKLEEKLKEINTEEHGMAVVCGSRSHLEKESIATRSIFRTFLMYGFHFLVWFLCVRNVADTQCGFKLMTREAARLLFTNLHVNRWAFDVDMLYLAQHFKIPISEIAVTWQEIEGSKMVPVFSWIQMGIDLFLIRLRYMFGIWKIVSKPKIE